MSKRVFQALKIIHWSPLVCFGLAWLLMQTEPMKQVAWRTLDWRTNLRVYFQPPADPRIGIILFEDSTEMNVLSWPPDRAYHGALIELLAQTKPAVLTWDVILDATREGDGDQKMGLSVQAAESAGMRVITGSVTNADLVEIEPGFDGPTRPLTDVTGDVGSFYGDDYAIVPFPQLRAASAYGFVDAPRGMDGIIREIPLVVRIGRTVYPSLALQTLMAYYQVAADKVRVRAGDAVYLPTASREVRVPISSSGMYFINYRYDHDDLRQDFQTDTYGSVLVGLNRRFVEGVATQAVPDYAGKILLVGQTVTGKADAGPTPRAAYSPLVLVHANVVNNVLANDFARRAPDWMVWLTLIAFGYLCVWLALTRSLMLLATVSLLVFVGYSSLAVWGWVFWSLWFPWVGPVIGLTSLLFIVIGRRVRQEQKAKQEIKGMFGSYVSPQVVEKLVSAGQPPQLGGHEAEITAFFSDIQNFTTFSERLAPDRLVELMNEYLTACTDVLQSEGGTLDKYIGDATVAIYGAPVPQVDHAYRACVTAVRIQARLDELREKWRQEGEKWPTIVHRIRTRIGLNSGACIVGNMGSRTRFNYTMMGDNVNLAARMESAAKNWGVYTMCTEATRLGCVEHGGDRIVFRPLGRIVVKGRARATPIHEVVGFKDSLAPTALDCFAAFAQGLERHYARDWDGALECFRRSAELESNIPGKTPGVMSNPSLVYLEIIEYYKVTPPERGWDGAFVMTEK